jgi:hypothetical protein
MSNRKVTCVLEPWGGVVGRGDMRGRGGGEIGHVLCIMQHEGIRDLSSLKSKRKLTFILWDIFCVLSYKYSILRFIKMKSVTYCAPHVRPNPPRGGLIVWFKNRFSIVMFKNRFSIIWLRIGFHS